MKNFDLILSFGGGVKSIGVNRFGGYGVLFSDATTPDLDGEYFTAETDFWLADRLKVPVLYAHGGDKALGRERLGSATFKQDETGVWFEFQLEKRNEYVQKIRELIASGKLGYSTAAALIEKVAGPIATWIKQWPIYELSLTPTPAEPRTQAIELKNYQSIGIDEALRRSKLSEVQLLREKSAEIRARALATLNGASRPDVWADEQLTRGRRHGQIEAARRDYLKMCDEAKESLTRLKTLEAEYNRLIDDAKNQHETDSQKYNRLARHYGGLKHGHIEIAKVMGW